MDQLHQPRCGRSHQLRCFWCALHPPVLFPLVGGAIRLPSTVSSCAVGDVDNPSQAPKTVIFTLRQVGSGEQLFFDYGPKYWEGRRAGPSSPEFGRAVAGAAEQDIDWDQAMEELD